MEFSISLKDNGYSRIFVDEYYDEEEKEIGRAHV